MEFSLGDMIRIGGGLATIVATVTYMKMRIRTLEKKFGLLISTVEEHTRILNANDKLMHSLAHKFDNMVGQLDKTFYPKEEAANTFVKKEVFDLHLKQFEYKLDMTNNKLTELLSMYKIKLGT